MPFETPTLDEQHLFLIALARALFPEIDLAEMSDEWLWTRTQAAGAMSNHVNIDAARSELLPDKSEGDLLRRWAKIRGVVPKTATAARKADALRVSGVAPTTVPDGTQFNHVSGVRIVTVGASIIGPSGYVDCDVVALDLGSRGKLSKDETLTINVPVIGLVDDAQLVLAIDDGGDDVEPDTQLRLRVLSRFSNPPLGGAAEDYVQWALEVSGYESAYSYPLRAGLGTVDLSALHDGSGAVRAPTAPEVAALQAIIDLKRPIAVKAFRVLQVTTEANNVDVKLVPDGQPQNAFDWNDQVAPTVNAFAANVLKFNGGARPATLKAGHRLTNAQGATGRERVVEVLGPAADEVTLEADDTGDTFAGGNTVHSGGPLVQPARAAIQELFDSLGTANPDAAPFGPWEGNLRPGDVRDAAKVEGARDAECVTPGAIVAPSDGGAPPNNTSVGLIVAGRILVRKKW